jgi:hypothetical protein
MDGMDRKGKVPYPEFPIPQKRKTMEDESIKKQSEKKGKGTACRNPTRKGFLGTTHKKIVPREGLGCNPL